MREELRRLVNVQQIDLRLDEVNQRIDEIPYDIKNLEEALEEKKRKINEISELIKKTELERKEKEMDLQSIEDEIRKNQAELNSIKTNEAYAAMLREIEKKKDKKGQLEEVVLSIMEKIDTINDEKKSANQTLKEDEERFKKGRADLENELAQMKENAEKIRAEKAEESKGIDGNTLDLYEKIRKSKHGLAVVSVNEDSCGGCHISIPAGKLNEIIVDKELVRCENCNRILYVKE